MSLSQADAAVVARLSDVSVEFPRKDGIAHALRGVSLEIVRGEILAIVGESGSGKSVLGASILGLVMNTEPAPTVAGRVVVFGTDMFACDERDRRDVRRRHLGAVFQDPMTSLNPTMRVGRQVIEVAGTEAEALRLLELAGISDARSRLRSYPHELSGGLRQRVMIALAVAGAPGLVVADEPTTALDVTIQAQILRLLRDLRDESGASFVLITHDIAVAVQIADRVTVMYAGRILETGSMAEVVTAPAHPYTAGLLACRVDMSTPRDRAVDTLVGEPPSPQEASRGCIYAPRCPRAQERCRSEEPRLQIGDREGRLVACHFPIEYGARRIRSMKPPQEETIAIRATRTIADGAVIRCSDVSVEFALNQSRWRRSALKALSNVNLQVDEGDAVAIVGESGCGKSTLLRVMAGLQTAYTGTVERAGERPQMVFQDAGASLTPWLMVGELVGERLRGTTSRGERTRLVGEALMRVGLSPEIARIRAGALSGGQRQRVVLARVTIVPPRLLLCDEPTSALDPSLAAVALNLLRRLRHDLGMALVFVTHDIAAARYIGDRIVVMNRGEIVEEGPAELVTTKPIHECTKALLAAVPMIEREAEGASEEGCAR